MSRTSSNESESVVSANRLRSLSSEYRWLQWNVGVVDGRWYTIARDVTGRRWLEEQAVHDPLTALANRAAITDRTAEALARLESDGELLGLLLIDLDHFKVINDGRGHEIGD